MKVSSLVTSWSSTSIPLSSTYPTEKKNKSEVRFGKRSWNRLVLTLWRTLINLLSMDLKCLVDFRKKQVYGTFIWRTITPHSQIRLENKTTATWKNGSAFDPHFTLHLKLERDYKNRHQFLYYLLKQTWYNFKVKYLDDKKIYCFVCFFLMSNSAQDRVSKKTLIFIQ